MTDQARYPLVYVPTHVLRSSLANPSVHVAILIRMMEKIRNDPTSLQTQPILARDDGTIYAGSLCWQALCQLYHEGWSGPWQIGHVPVILTGTETLTRQDIGQNGDSGAQEPRNPVSRSEPHDDVGEPLTIVLTFTNETQLRQARWCLLATDIQEALGYPPMRSYDGVGRRLDSDR